MATGKKKKLGSGGVGKIGRAANKPSKQRYKSTNRRYHHKLKRVRKSSGEVAAAAYAKQFGGRASLAGTQPASCALALNE